MATLKEQAYIKLKKQVVDAEPGTLFSVRKSASDLGLSYTPVREALVEIQNEGLLEVIPNVGFEVVQLDMKQIRKIYQSRECVEQYVLPLVVKMIDDDDMMILRAYINKQRCAMEREDVSVYTEVDAQFHIYLIDLLQNRQITEFYKSVRSQYRMGSWKIKAEHSNVPIEEHEKFLDLVEEKRYQEAVECMKDHLEASVERMKEGYVQIGV